RRTPCGVARLADGARRPGPTEATRGDGTVTLRHRDGGTVTVWVLAHRRITEDGGAGDWLAVTPLDTGAQELPDDPLVRAAVFQSPCATMLVDRALPLRGVNDAMA